MAKAKPVEIGGIKFNKKGDALNFMKDMLNKYAPEEKVDENDSKFLSSAILKHPEFEKKLVLELSSFLFAGPIMVLNVFGWKESTARSLIFHISTVLIVSEVVAIQ